MTPINEMIEAIEFLDTQSTNNPMFQKGLKIIKKALPIGHDPKDRQVLNKYIREKEAFKDIEHELIKLEWIDERRRLVKHKGNILRIASLIRILFEGGFFKKNYNGKKLNLQMVSDAAKERYGIKNLEEIYRMEKFEKYEPIVRKEVTCLIPQNRPSYQRKLKTKA